jgi:hypothetical protein
MSPKLASCADTSHKACEKTKALEATLRKSEPRESIKGTEKEDYK